MRSRSSAFLTVRWISKDSAIWSPTLIVGFSAAIGSWNTMPISLPLTRAIAASGRAVRSRPSSRTDPLTIRPPSGSTRSIDAPIIDLPLPDSPTSPTVSPASI